MNQVANKTRQELICLGDDGTSPDYTYYKFNEIRHQILDNDIIIIALTDINRRWFLHDNPADTIWNIIARSETVSEALEKYLRYLNNKDVHDVYLFNFLVNLHRTTEKLNTHTIILPCFESVNDYTKGSKEYYDFTRFHIARGYLYDVALKEFEPDFFNSYHVLKYGQRDLRCNHLMKSNHTILANKIVDNIRRNIPIDLNRGFVTNILNKEKLKNKEFSASELFDIHLDDNVWNFHKF